MSRHFLTTAEARRILGPIGFAEVRRGARFPHWDSARQQWFAVAYVSTVGFFLDPAKDTPKGFSAKETQR